MTVVALTLACPAQQEVVRHYDDGTVRERYTVDEQGRKDGRYESFHPTGKPELVGTYRAGLREGAFREFDPEGRRLRAATYRKDLLHGRYEEFRPNGGSIRFANYRDGELDGAFSEESEDGEWKRTGRYRDGELHGSVKITIAGKVASRQRWDDGLLTRLDDLRPFPVAKADLLTRMRGILEPDGSTDPGEDPLAPKRQAALRLLQAYRYLCDLPCEEMSLVPEWNELCDAAAEVCRRNGGLSHDPPRPPDMPEERYRMGKRGAGSSNLSVGGGMVRSVDSYMNDSDPSNIDRIGHRRWCLNPTMRRTAFGEDGAYSAMWSFDSSGSAPKGMTAVYYPPPGYVPVDFFGPRHAWSISLLRGGTPRQDELKVSIRALDEFYLPHGEELELDHLDVAAAGFGSGPCIVFRPRDLDLRPGKRYLIAVSSDSGRSWDHRYLVEFCEAVR